MDVAPREMSLQTAPLPIRSWSCLLRTPLSLRDINVDFRLFPIPFIFTSLFRDTLTRDFMNTRRFQMLALTCTLAGRPRIQWMWSEKSIYKSRPFPGFHPLSEFLGSTGWKRLSSLIHSHSPPRQDSSASETPLQRPRPNEGGLLGNLRLPHRPALSPSQAISLACSL